MRRRRLAAAAVAAGSSTLLAAAPAAAHGLVGRADLPIPTWLFGWAAAIVLVVSFVALGALWPAPLLAGARRRALVRVPGAVDVVGGAIGMALFALVVYAGYAGSPVAAENFTPTFVYVIFWVGLPIVSVLFGDVFRLLNPWRAFARVAIWIWTRRVGTRASREYPQRLGRWPAAAGLVGFAWIELAFQNRAQPSMLATAALLYAGVQLAGMAAYGVEAWSERGDAFGVLFGLYARLSVFERLDGELRLRPPLTGTPGLLVVPGTVALLCTAIGTTTFDGLSSGSLWSDLSPHLRRFFGDLGAGTATAGQWSASVGIVACIGLVLLVYETGVAGIRTVSAGELGGDPRGRFVHTLVPIAFAYTLAHYFSLFVYQGQAMGYLISNPLGDGSNLLGTAGSTIDYGVITTTAIWYVQVAALVIGHVAGLALAHDRAVELYRDPRAALRSQAWMLVVMVGFTSLGLWLLSAVVT